MPDAIVEVEFEISRREERELFATVRGALPERHPLVSPPWEMGGGLPLLPYEVIAISLAAAVNAKALVAPVVEWMRKRFKKSDRPKKANFYGPDGKILFRVTLKEPHGKPKVWKSKRKLKKRKR